MKKTKKSRKNPYKSSSAIVDPTNFSMVMEKYYKEMESILEDVDQQIFNIEQSSRAKISKLLGIRNWYEPEELEQALKKTSIPIKLEVDKIKSKLETDISTLKRKHMPSAYDTSKNTLKAIHFSRKSDLTIIDPKLQGTGHAGEERKSSEYKMPPFSNFYVVGSNSYIEPIFDGFYAYEAEIKRSSLYDSREGLIPTKEIIKNGYKGMYFNSHQGKEQVRMFVPVKVKILGKSNFGKNRRINGLNVRQFINKV